MITLVNARGAPRGNQNAAKNGITGLRRMRKGGEIDKRTSFGRAFEARKAEYISHLGGDELSVMELAIIEDTVWTDFYTMAYDIYLSRLKSVIRKGRPHPVVDARTRLAAHRRENLKNLGLRRRTKTVSLQEILAKDEPEVAAAGNGQDETK